MRLRGLVLALTVGIGHVLVTNLRVGVTSKPQQRVSAVEMNLADFSSPNQTLQKGRRRRQRRGVGRRGSKQGNETTTRVQEPAQSPNTPKDNNNNNTTKADNKQDWIRWRNLVLNMKRQGENKLRLSEMQEDYRKCALDQPHPRPNHACYFSNQTKIPYCHIQMLRIDVSRIDCSAGGEDLESVMGRKESLEVPKYNKGALSTPERILLPEGVLQKRTFYVKDFVHSVDIQDLPCVEIRSRPTLFVQRYEYANLFHTLLDWWSAFFVMPAHEGTVDVVFLDGHARGNLDSVWSHLWGNVVYLKQLAEGGVCFENAVLVPSGHSSVLWPRERNLPRVCIAMMNAFERFFVEGYGLQGVSLEWGRITIIDRRPYVAHPRGKSGGEPQRILTNLDELKVRLEQETNATLVEVIRLEHMSFQEQLTVLRKTHIVIANHGAALSFLVFMSKGAHVLEFEAPASHFFGTLAGWKPHVTRTLLPSAPGPLLTESLMAESVLPTVRVILSL